MTSNADSREIVELDEDFIVIAVPVDTVELKLTAKIYSDGELQTVEKVMPFQEVRAAMKEANDGYIPSDAVFTLAPLGREKITALVDRYLEKVDEDT